MVLNMKTRNGSRTNRELEEMSKGENIVQRRKYSKMDKRAKDKLVRSPRENGAGQDAQKDSSFKNWKG